MDRSFVINEANETINLLNKMNTIFYLFGLSGFWVEDVKLPRKFTKIFDVISIIFHIMCGILSVLIFLAIFTQKNATSKQREDAIVVGFSNSISHVVTVDLISKRKEVQKLLYDLAVKLKKYYNDKEIENDLVTQVHVWLKIYMVTTFTAISSYGVKGLLHTLKTGESFIAIVTAWPDVADTSHTATCARIGLYLFWLIYFYRVFFLFFILLLVLLSLTHQYKILNSYFESLNEIFEDQHLSQESKEIEFEKAFINGIKMHSRTIRCVRRCQQIFRNIFSTSVMTCLSLLIALMIAMMNNENDFERMCTQMATLAVVFITLASEMWTAGDVTIEASRLPYAIYGCGWYNCRGKSAVRIRSLVTFAINKAQKPMVLYALGIFELSHETFVKVYRCAYSVFSVFY